LLSERKKYHPEYREDPDYGKDSQKYMDEHVDDFFLHAG